MIRLTPLVIVGAGGFGREVLDVVIAINTKGSPYDSEAPYDFLGFLDDGEPDAELLGRRGARRIGSVASPGDLNPDTRFVIGVGDPDARRRIDEKMTGLGLDPTILVHPTVALGSDICLELGVIVCSHVSLTTNVHIGRHAHINLNCTVGHDSQIGNFATLNPGANVSGEVILEDGVTLGTNAAVIQGLTIGTGTVVGAGASVVRDLPAGVVAVGVPARPR